MRGYHLGGECAAHSSSHSHPGAREGRVIRRHVQRATLTLPLQYSVGTEVITSVDRHTHGALFEWAARQAS